jgi:5'-nucleotidase
MLCSIKNKLVIAVTTRALFDLEEENRIFEENGLEEYSKYLCEHEMVVLEKGTAFALIEMFLNLNKAFKESIVEIIIMTRNKPCNGIRISNSIKKYALEIGSIAYTGGEPLVKYFEPYNIDLFLSKNEGDVQDSINTGVAAALLYDIPKDFQPNDNEIRIAFDADAVIFSEESELIYKKKGLDSFIEHEQRNAMKSLPEGPFGQFIQILSGLKVKCPGKIKIAIVTSRSSSVQDRVNLTLREWGVDVDEAFFLGGKNKKSFLKSYNPHMFFDDQDAHVLPASKQIPAGRVLYKSDSELNKL